MTNRLLYFILGFSLALSGVIFYQRYEVVRSDISRNLMIAGIYDGEQRAERNMNLLEAGIKKLPVDGLRYNECWIVRTKNLISFNEFWTFQVFTSDSPDGTKSSFSSFLEKETSERCKGKDVIRIKN